MVPKERIHLPAERGEDCLSVDDQSPDGEADAAPKISGVFSRLLTLLREPLYTSALYLWISAASVGLGGLAYWTLTARLYDPDDVGRASAALSVLVFVGMFSHLGLGLGLIRFLPQSPDEGPRLVNVVFTASAAFAAVASVVFLVGLPWWTPSLGFLRENLLHAIAIVAFAISAVSVTVQSHVFLAIRRAKYILAQTVVLVLARVVVVILMASFFGAFGIVAAWGLATVLAMLMGFALLAGNFTGYRPRTVVDPAALRMMAPFSAGIHFADSVLSAPGLLMPLLVVSLVGSEEAAYFFMAWFLGLFVSTTSWHLSLSLFTEGSHDPGHCGFSPAMLWLADLWSLPRVPRSCSCWATRFFWCLDRTTPMKAQRSSES